MWVTCENCEGEGYVFISITSDYQILHEKYLVKYVIRRI